MEPFSYETCFASVFMLLFPVGRRLHVGYGRGSGGSRAVTQARQ